MGVLCDDGRTVSSVDQVPQKYFRTKIFAEFFQAWLVVWYDRLDRGYSYITWRCCMTSSLHTTSGVQHPHTSLDDLGCVDRSPEEQASFPCSTVGVSVFVSDRWIFVPWPQIYSSSTTITNNGDARPHHHSFLVELVPLQRLMQATQLLPSLYSRPFRVEYNNLVSNGCCQSVRVLPHGSRLCVEWIASLTTPPLISGATTVQIRDALTSIAK